MSTQAEGTEESKTIACSLPQGELLQVTEEYRGAASLYRATVRADAGGLVISLQGPQAALRTFLEGMIERESRCCPFLNFGLAETPQGFDVILRGDGLTEEQLRIVSQVLFPTATGS